MAAFSDQTEPQPPTVQRFGFLSTAMYSGVSTLTRVLSSLIISKSVAVAIGPAGLAIVGQFQNFSSILTTFSTAGVSTGVIRYVAEFREDTERRRMVISTALWTMIASTGSVALLIALLRRQFAVWLLDSGSYSTLVGAFAATLLLTFLTQLVLAILNGYKDISRLTYINIAGSVLGAALTYVLATHYGVQGALLSLVLTPVAVFLLTAGWSLWGGWIRLTEFAARFDSRVCRNLMHYAAMALVTAVTLPAALILVRTYLGKAFSEQAAGYWQAVWRISDTYLLLVTNALAVYYLPRLAELKNDAQVRREIFHVGFIAMPLVLVSAGSIYVLRDYVLRILFATSFFPARELFAYQLTGDCLKIASWLLSYLMIARAMTKTYIATELIFSGSFVVLTIALTRLYGLRGVTYAFTLNYVLYLLLMIFLFRRLLFRPAVAAPPQFLEW